MFKINQLFVTLLITAVSVLATGSDMKDTGADRGAHSDRGGLWFGPRLGKRSLRLNGETDRQAFFKLLEAADALKYYSDQLPSYESQAEAAEARKVILPKERRHSVIFTPKLGRSLYEDQGMFENVEFTPRLGRRIAEDMPATPSDDEIYRPDPEQVDSRLKFFSPRLGRELAYENYPSKIRLVRSANKTTST